MRKELRIGLGVGSAVVVGLLAWALFPSSSRKDNSASKPAPAPAQRSETPQPVTEATPSVAPENPGARAEGSSGHAAVEVGPAENIGATPVPSDNMGSTSPRNEQGDATASAGTGAWDWARALDQGAPVPLLARTQTPPPGVGGGTALAAPARSGTTESVASGVSSSGAGGRKHTVKSGETYWTIAQAEYGNGALYTVLMKANPEVPANRLRPGLVINVPDRSEVNTAGAGVTAASSSVGGTGAAAGIDPNTQYRVQPGDSLYSICRKLYGRADRERLEKLYELNKEAIGPNRSALKQNMILKLPEPPSSSAGAGGVAGAAQ